MLENAIRKFVETYYLYIVIAIAVLNISQRRYMPRSMKKRIATLILACAAMVLDICLVIILDFELPIWLCFVALGLVVIALILLKDKAWPFKYRCVECGQTLSFKEILNFDDNTCEACYRKAHPEEFKDEKEPEAALLEKPELATDVAQIDWDNWEPKETCVVTYLFDGDRILFIDKKTGLGNGLVNVPGGHVEEGETAVEAAIREYKEEVGLDISDLKYTGLICFQFKDGLSLKGHVFTAEKYSGELIETAEARPFWVEKDKIPYDRMWADDAVWLPLLLEGKKFTGHFLFDDRTMLSYSVTEDEKESDGGSED